MKKKHSKFLLNVNGKKYRAESLIGIVWKYIAGKKD